MDVWMGGMLTQSSPRGIGVWKGKNLLPTVLFSYFVLFGRGWLIVGPSFPTRASSSLSILSLEHPFPQGILTLGILIPEHPFSWESSLSYILLSCTH